MLDKTENQGFYVEVNQSSEDNFFFFLISHKNSIGPSVKLLGVCNTRKANYCS